MARWTIHRKDTSQDAIVAALEAAGWLIFKIGSPCDLLCYRRSTDTWRTLECKTPTKSGKLKKRKDQPKQDEFLALTGTPRVTTPEQALQALEPFQLTISIEEYLRRESMLDLNGEKHIKQASKALGKI